MAERLYRSRDDRMLAGVAGGMAEILDADPSIVRVAWALLTILTGGIALVVYIVMAIVVPDGPGGQQPSSGASPAPGAAAAPGPIPPAASWASDMHTRRAERRARRTSGDPGRGGLLAGLVLIVIGGLFLIREFVPWFDWRVWWPVVLIGLGVLLLVFALRPGKPD